MTVSTNPTQRSWFKDYLSMNTWFHRPAIVSVTIRALNIGSSRTSSQFAVIGLTTANVEVVMMTGTESDCLKWVHSFTHEAVQSTL